MMTQLRRAARLVAVLLVTACSTGTADPTSTPEVATTGATTATPASATPRASPTQAPTAAPAPSGLLPIPTGFAAELEPGRYWSAPPFDLGFAFEIAEDGWVAGHLNPEFFDLQRYAGRPVEGTPDRTVAFAHPLTIRGATNVPVSGLTPAEAVAELVARQDIDATNVTEEQLFGREAVRVDLHAPIEPAPVFGGDAGTFTLTPEMDARLAAVAIEGGLLLAIVLAPPGELEAAWAQALPILDSVELP